MKYVGAPATARAESIEYSNIWKDMLQRIALIGKSFQLLHSRKKCGLSKKKDARSMSGSGISVFRGSGISVYYNVHGNAGTVCSRHLIIKHSHSVLWYFCHEQIFQVQSLHMSTNKLFPHKNQLWVLYYVFI